MSNQSKKMKVIFSGGGTLGSVAPLIAIYEELKKAVGRETNGQPPPQPELEFLWLGTKAGPEREIVESYGISFKTILSAKLRRYFSWKNFLDILVLPLAIIQGIFIIIKHKPKLIMSAGGFVSVPVVIAGWLLKVPAIIHQQDVRPGLANKLMAPFAKLITVTFAESAKSFPTKKTIVAGNPVRVDILAGDKNKAQKIFQLEPALPTLLVLGGGTGAQKINQLIIESLPALVEFCQIIHITGAGKSNPLAKHKRYHQYEFITDNLKHAYAVADLVVTRAGMSTLTELAALKKPTIIIPIPESHQVDNAAEFAKFKAAVVLEQNELDASRLVEIVKSLLADRVRLENLSGNIGKMMAQDAARVLAERILNNKS